MTNVLLLGGTQGARILAASLHRAGVAATYSYAGVTRSPRLPELPTRVGGFGGVAGLVRYLREHRITHVIDATHPFAAQMSRHAIEACRVLGIPLLALERRPWTPQPGDRWTHVPDMAAAAAALPAQPTRVFLAIGRKQLAAFAGQPAHHYLLRVVDAPVSVLAGAGGFETRPYEGEGAVYGDDGAVYGAFPHHTLIVARGPFALADELAMLREHRIQLLVSKNAGGMDTYAKLEAARELGLPVILVDRPALPARECCETVQEAMDWLGRMG